MNACTGVGCAHCARIEAELNERRAQLRDYLDRLDEPDQIRILREIAWENPDVVNDAITEVHL